ncbi:MAG TPA: hypothetical protein VMC43_02020 [Candidatus Paceibacterota bacterium]|nr:hypothetical protein [Candidatus Paceibacterota bacterium]
MNKEFVDVVDLTGFHIETWCQVAEIGERGGINKVLGYFKTERLAKAFAVGKGEWGGNAHVSPVEVATKDGRTGFIVHPNEKAELEPETEAKAAMKAKALEKLSPEERALFESD